ncbi:hypothetical protein BpHYR1_022195 [Brachionus plicatilis]|uniref:Uncharacterized protein n=1 Tax=Brachionus plicatilis TaxID=10195 RepID=A0A3M7P878_BRAPC|nr:hypothetical protein BpHYR1_022195 [Brachionus plicatilis]
MNFLPFQCWVMAR